MIYRRARRTSTAACWRSPRPRAARIINRDRMWHYTEGIENWNPIWPSTASASCRGRRRSGSTRAASACRCRSFPASTRWARSSTSCETGYDYSWFILTQKIIEKEFALSGSEQNPDLTEQEHARRCSGACASGRAAAGQGVHGARRGFHRRARAADAGAPHERAHRGEPLLDLAARGARDRRARPRDRQSRSARICRSSPSAARAAIWATG